MLKKYLKRLGRGLGFEVKKWRWNPTYLRQLIEARTVVDVGAGLGTIELHRAFPGAKFLLVEPIVDYREHLEKLARRYDCELIFKGLGEREEVREFMVDPGQLTRSSAQRRTGLTDTGAVLESRAVEVTTLDKLLEERPALPGPLALKIDTEGFELEVIRGGREFLRRTDLIIAEVSIGRRFEGGYSLEEFVAELASCGFSAFDVLRVSHVRGAPGAKFADMVFGRREE